MANNKEIGWDQDAIDSAKEHHHDPSFTGPNLSDKAQANGRTGLFVKLSMMQVTSIITILAGLIAAISTHYLGDPHKSATDLSLAAPAASQMESQITVHEVRLNNHDKILDQHQAHDERIERKLDAIQESINELKVSVARNRPIRPVREGGN